MRSARPAFSLLLVFVACGESGVSSSNPGIGPGDDAGAPEAGNTVDGAFTITPRDAAPAGVDATPDSPPSSTAIKFHQGNYLWFGGWLFAGDPYQESQNGQAFITETCSNSNITGYELDIYWDAIEPSQDKYDFTYIDDLLTRATACGKRLILLLNPQTYGSIITFQPTGLQGAPQYLVSSTYGPCCTGAVNHIWQLGGVSMPADSAGGYIRGTPKVWVPEVMDRWIALVNALGARYDKNANFEGIAVMGETAVATYEINYPAFVTQLVRLIKASQTAFPHTWARIGTNFTDTDSSMKTIIEACAASTNCILGGPDPLYAAEQVGVRPPGYAQGADVYNGTSCEGCAVKDYRPLVGFITETQFDMNQTGYPPYIGGAGPPPDGCDEDVNVIRTYSEGPGLNSKYLIWTKSGDCYDPSGAQTGILDSINSMPAISSTSCPANFTGGCNTN